MVFCAAPQKKVPQFYNAGGGGGREESTLYVANKPYSPPLPAKIIAHIYRVDPGGGRINNFSFFSILFFNSEESCSSYRILILEILSEQKNSPPGTFVRHFLIRRLSYYVICCVAP